MNGALWPVLPRSLKPSMKNTLMVCRPHVFGLSDRVVILNVGYVAYGFSPRHHKDNMSTDTYRLIAENICFQFPMAPVHCRSDRPISSTSLPLNRSATFFEYVVVEGKRYHASRTTGTNKSSFAHVVIPGSSPTDAYGEVMEVIQVNHRFQQRDRPLWFVQMRWFKPWTGEREQLWDDL